MHIDHHGHHQKVIKVLFIVYLLFFFTVSGNRSMPGSKPFSTLPTKSVPIIPDGNALKFIIVSYIITITISADMTTQLLLKKETDVMVQRAIASASKHGINLKHGTPNPGTGDCAFEAVIQNNNDRSCFREKYEMTVDWYRRIWATDMANRARDTPYNIFTDQQWQEGWAEMMTPGIYERGLFGDLMLAGIACGIKKILLIFNTNPNTPHDPIYVVNPSQFNVQADLEVPIVLAYNLSHYESMEPCTSADIQSTIRLVRDYEEERYRYGKKDILSLITLNE